MAKITITIETSTKELARGSGKLLDRASSYVAKRLEGSEIQHRLSEIFHFIMYQPSDDQSSPSPEPPKSSDDNTETVDVEPEC